MIALPLLFWRPLLREPVRTALTILAVALGVAVVIAIDLAGDAAAGSFHSSIESLTGKTDLLLSSTGGIDERLLGDLARLPYPIDFAPRIEDFAFVEGKGEAVPFIGVDLIGHHSQEVEDGNFEQPLDNAIFVAGLGLHRGQRVKLLINDVMREFTVAGILKSSAGESSAQNLIVADIGLAQAATGKTSRLDTIAARVPSSESTEYWQQLIQQNVPPSVKVEPQGARTSENRKMLSAFRWNLRVLSYIALVVGGFLIYNTISISVVRRRAEIGVLRAIGATRAFIAGGFLFESLLFAITGSALGLVLGRVLSVGAVALVGKTVQSLYVSSEPGEIHLSLESALAGVGLGLAVSLLAALGPAMEAARVPPTEAMARGREEYQAVQHSGRRLLVALAMFIVAGGLSQLPALHGQPLAAYLAVVLMIAGTAAAIPAIVLMFSRVSSATTLKIFGPEALLALQSLRASLSRTGVLTAALTTAVAMTTSVGIMVGSFRYTVAAWMDNQLKADFYLRPAGSAAADRHPTMSAAIADRIEALPGVESVDRFRAYAVTFEGLPATLAGAESWKHQNAASTRFLPGEDRNKISATLPTGDYAVVSEPFANKHSVTVGSTLQIALAGAERSFRVLGIYSDYSTERGYIILARNILLKYLPDEAISNMAVYSKPGANADKLRSEIDAIIAGSAVMVFPNRALRRGAIEIFDRTFRITYALEAVSIAVAVMGIAGALLAMVIDRRREFALLRFLGADQAQIRGIVLFEAGLLGLLSNLIGLILGGVLSLILIFVINKQSFGWTFQFHWPTELLLAALGLIYLATVLAGLYPARTALRMNPIEVIHEQ